MLLGAGAAAAAVPDHPSPAHPSPARRLWECRLARYRRIAAEAEAAAETGWFRAANARYGRETEALAARFGSWKAARVSAEGGAEAEAAWRRMDEAEEAYWARCTDPMQDAAVAVALTPAPGIEAVREKIGIMRAAGLQELGRMKRDCLEVLMEDLVRLGG
ncbi:MAG TPA: hypothetical protein VEZ20_15100 [Allosphingosinicella sp.]|nr:hypothetical protein [Allosphingosinicella sp.]